MPWAFLIESAEPLTCLEGAKMQLGKAPQQNSHFWVLTLTNLPA